MNLKSFLLFCPTGSATFKSKPRSLNYFLFILILFASCREEYQRNKSHSNVPDASIRKGKELATKYCQSCHLLPDPGLVNSMSWERGVLPQMGPRLGIFFHDFKQYPSKKYDPLLDADFYPKTPLLTNEEWGNILDYYTATSPDAMPAQNKEKNISEEATLFDIVTPSFDYPYSSTSFIRVDTLQHQARVILCDASRKKTYVLNKDLVVTDSIQNTGPIVDYEKIGTGLLGCDIGIMNPNNGKFGKALFLDADKNGKYREESKPLFDSLQRPVQISAADLNSDGLTDYVVCEFGFITGSFSWMENMGNSQFNRHVLKPLPGAIKAYIKDFNNDGLPDIMVLMAQGDESIVLYTNNGKGTFKEEQLLRFPPSYGSSYFELDDFNKDGFADIVYTCGDNADYSPILKPYHGVYIFLNDKTNNFIQQYFYPINGCYKAMARDFDADGDLDIAAISFFADFKDQPEEGFVYLKNEGDLKFSPFSVPGTQNGRWLTMDAGDVDGDGKPDIVLGNFAIGPIIKSSASTWQKAAPFIVLKNIMK